MEKLNSSFAEYWGRILAAILLIKMATTLVRDAEKLITANVKARNPEVAAVVDAPTTEAITNVGPAEWAEPINGEPVNGNGLSSEPVDSEVENG